MRYLLALILMLCSAPLFGQDIATLEREQRQAKAEIAKIEAELKGVTSSKKSNEQKLTLLKRRIAQREKVVANIDSQIEILTSKHDNQNTLQSANWARLRELQTFYESSILLLHKSYVAGGFRSILVTSDNREKILRQRYFATILASSIASQAARIAQLQNMIGVEIGVITSQKERLIELRAKSDAELKLIASERREVESMGSTLKKEEKSLLAARSEQRRALDALQAAIARIVRAEVASSSAANAPLSGSFAAAKGRLISPLKSSKIVDSYGVHNHPSEKGLKIDNKGINLAGASGGAVSAIFEGEVKRVFVVPGMGRSVLIRHGEYISVYSSLGNVTVSAGQKVKGGANIGNVGSDGILHFEIWREDVTQNPASWIAL